MKMDQSFFSRVNGGRSGQRENAITAASIALAVAITVLCMLVI